VVLLNSDAGDENIFWSKDNPGGLDPRELGNAVQPGGYVIWVRSVTTPKPYGWWSILAKWDLLPSVDDKVSPGQADALRFVQAGESFLVDLAPNRLSKFGLRGRRVSFLKKILVRDQASVHNINEVFTHLPGLQKHEPSSEERAFGQLLRMLWRGRGCVFSPTHDLTFLATLRRAAQLANWRLLCSESTYANLEGGDA
jgi:hypothetical protein